MLKKFSIFFCFILMFIGVFGNNSVRAGVLVGDSNTVTTSVKSQVSRSSGLGAGSAAMTPPSSAPSMNVMSSSYIAKTNELEELNLLEALRWVLTIVVVGIISGVALKNVVTTCAARH